LLPEYGPTKSDENPSVITAFTTDKPRPNDRIMSTQHIATLLGHNMLRAFGHRVATCCDMLGVVGSNVTIFKLEPTTPIMLQHIATRWPNAHTMLRPTMLRYVVLTCRDRLAGA